MLCVVPPSEFRVLVVCTANMCRSPMVERILLSGLRSRLDAADAARFAVASAGTHSDGGGGMHPFAISVLTAAGVWAEDFESQRLSQALVESADLVLAATRAHRSAAVTLAPPALRYAFTLLEFGRLVASLPASTTVGVDDVVTRARALTAAAAGHRGVAGFVPPEDDDLPDPIGEPLPAYEATMAAAVYALRPFLDRLADGS